MAIYGLAGPRAGALHIGNLDALPSVARAIVDAAVSNGSPAEHTRQELQRQLERAAAVAQQAVERSLEMSFVREAQAVAGLSGVDGGGLGSLPWDEAIFERFVRAVVESGQPAGIDELLAYGATTGSHALVLCETLADLFPEQRVAIVGSVRQTLGQETTDPPAPAGPERPEPDVALLLDRAYILVELERYTDALDVLSRARAAGAAKVAGLGVRTKAQVGLGRADVALGDVEEALVDFPHDSDLLVLRLQLLPLLDRFAETVSACDDALAAGAEPDMVLPTRSEANFQLVRYAEALDDIDGVAAIWPERPDLMLLRAHCLLQLTRHADAIRAYGEAEEAGAWAAQVFANRAVAYAALGRATEALADLDRAVGGAPDDDDLLMHAARLVRPADLDDRARGLTRGARVVAARVKGLLGADEAADALADAEAALKTWPGDYALLLGRARALAELDRRDEALVALAALGSGPASADHAALLYAVGRRDESIAEYRSLLASAPADEEALFGLLRPLIQDDQHEEALAACAQALASGASAEPIERTRAFIYWLDNEPRKQSAALRAVTAAGGRLEDDELRKLAQAHLLGGEFGSTIEVCDIAARSGADDADADWHLYRLSALFLLDRCEEIIALGEISVRRWPQEDGVRSNLAAALLVRGRVDESLAALGDCAEADQIGWWHLWRGLARWCSDDRVGAKADFDRAAHLGRTTPHQDAMWPANLAHALLFSGDLAGAESEYTAPCAPGYRDGVRAATLAELQHFAAVVPEWPGLQQMIGLVSGRH